MKLLRTLNRLKDPRDLWLFLQLLSTLILLPRRIRRHSLPDLLKLMDPGIGTGQKDSLTLGKTVGFVDSLLKYRVFRRYGKCLLRSLLLFRYLRRQGWPVEIHFGVRRMGNEAASGLPDEPPEATSDFDIMGHSWLVLEGEPFLEASAPHAYSETFCYPED